MKNSTKSKKNIYLHFFGGFVIMCEHSLKVCHLLKKCVCFTRILLFFLKKFVTLVFFL